MDETLQKRYSTVAALYYRDSLKKKLDLAGNAGGSKKSFGKRKVKSLEVEKPDYFEGRRRCQGGCKCTP